MNKMLHQEFQRFGAVLRSYTKWTLGATSLVAFFLLFDAIIKNPIGTTILLSVLALCATAVYVKNRAAKIVSRSREGEETFFAHDEQPRSLTGMRSGSMNAANPVVRFVSLVLEEVMPILRHAVVTASSLLIILSLHYLSKLLPSQSAAVASIIANIESSLFVVVYVYLGIATSTELIISITTRVLIPKLRHVLFMVLRDGRRTMRADPVKSLTPDLRENI